MITDSLTNETFSFEIEVPRRDYTALVHRLRGAAPRSATPTRSGSPVKAIVDLSPNTSTFAITGIGYHRLPRPLTIRSGSGTHAILSQSIAKELSEISDPELSAKLKAIITACPKVTISEMRVRADDFYLETEVNSLGNNDLNHRNSISNARVLATLTPAILLDLDDTPPLTITEAKPQVDTGLYDLIRCALKETLKVKIVVTGNTVDLWGSAVLPNIDELTPINLVAHWGCYDELSRAWQDERLSLSVDSDGSNCNKSAEFTFKMSLNAPIRGSYGLTFFASIGDSPERIWIGQPLSDDHRFVIDSDDQQITNNWYTDRLTIRNKAKDKVRGILSDYQTGVKTADWLCENAPQLSLGALLNLETQHSPGATELLEATLDQLRKSGAGELAKKISSAFGLGELVFVTPEGPHASAGGLAHVITGLPKELVKLGIPVTIIAPLYHYANGNKHRAADEVLRDGLILGGTRVYLRYTSTVNVELGPTHHSGSSHQKRPATSVPCRVYSAESKGLRIVLLANSSSFDRLYQPVHADEQLRRAILFSKAALETIREESLDIRPSAIISNDWMTACVPSLLALDPRYKEREWLRAAKSIHIIHNGGADYHGRLPIQNGNEDLWPLFGLAPEHYFGFRDPFSSELINFTVAATRHATGGILTVSQPYASALMTQAGGDGLDQTIKDRRDSLYGISNGINRDEIESWLAHRVNQTRADLSRIPNLIGAKLTLKLELQRSLGLKVNSNAPLISVVGRLAEQKGLDLLSGIVRDSGHSALEELLIKNPISQVVIAGPLTTGDRSAEALYSATRYLQGKYPGRIAGVFDYVSHSFALEVMAASTLFLMPSRFEPGGITQLEALALGTPVVGRGIGGILATIDNYKADTGRGTGFLCYDYSPTAFAETVNWALSICADQNRYPELIAQAVGARHSWAERAPTFLAVLQRIVLGASRVADFEFLAESRKLVDSARV